MSTATDVVAVSFAGGSLLVSGWAGWTAHKARRWQRERDEERRATRVRVEFAHAVGHDRVWAWVSATPPGAIPRRSTR